MISRCHLLVVLLVAGFLDPLMDAADQASVVMDPADGKVGDPFP